MASRCRSRKADGSACEAQPVRADGYCYWHSPELAELRDQKNREGGRNRSNAQRAKKALPAEVLTAEEIRSWLGLVFKGVIAGKIEPGVATASATVARALLETAKVSEIESQLAELEKAVGGYR
jgi:hypothetical protein